MNGAATMLYYALIFLLVAIAGVLEFGGIAAISVEIARILVVLFLVLFVVSLVIHVVRGRAARP